MSFWATVPRWRKIVLAIYFLALMIVLIFGNPAHARAQTATPTPSQTPTPPATYTPFPYGEIVGTLGTPTTIPDLSLTPKPWYTPTRPTPGAAFNPPSLNLSTPAIGENPANGFQAITDSNSLTLGRYIGEVAVGFYNWCVANFPAVLRALRLFSFIVFFMAVLMALFRRFAPDLVVKTDSWRRGQSVRRDGRP